MKQRSKNVIVLVLAAFFAFGILCSTFAAPGQALASVNGCSQTPGGMEMTGCEHPNYLCGFDPSSLLSQGALSSARPDDSVKNYLSVAVGEASIASSNSEASSIARERQSAFPAAAHKVSIRLFNSILNL
jgi:hypothetical protein